MAALLALDAAVFPFAVPGWVLLSPLAFLVLGLLVAALGARGLRRSMAPRDWPHVRGTIVDHRPDAAKRPLDIVEYPLPEGGFHRVTASEHGTYVSGRPVGTATRVWRDPVDALNARLDQPTLDSHALPLLITALGGFFALGGLIWLVLLLAL